LLGLVEEVGELSHAHLKQEQGIRGTVESYRSKKIDAVGDIVIFLANYCTQQGLSFEECVLSAWNEVKQRDWQKDPTNGTNQRT
jgi:NTP pyrophosphatase (non-canonical NTP hydrolase)